MMSASTAVTSFSCSSTVQRNYCQKTPKSAKKWTDFIKDKLQPGKDDVRIWMTLLKKRSNHWSGKKLLDKSAKENDRDTEALEVLKNWQLAFHLLESAILTSSSLFKVYLTLSESIFGGKIGSSITHLANMDTWRDYMVWGLRDKMCEPKYLTLCLQPANLASTLQSEKSDQLEVLRVRLLWQVGRILASHNMLKEDNYGQTVGLALKYCLEDGEYPPTQTHFHMAAEMICHMCVPPIDIPFRTDNIKKLAQPLIPADFLAIAPAVTNELIRLICLCDTKRAELSINDISHTLTCFLSALGKCPIEVLPCLDRIAEFVDQQAHSKQATTIIRKVLGRIPERLIRTRFESDNTESGFASITMKSEVARPQHSVVQVLKLWILTAQLFTTKISRGSEVSNEPDRTQLLSLLNFMCVPFKLKPPGDKVNNCPESLIANFKVEFGNLFKVITSSASTLRDYSKDKFIASIVRQIHDTALSQLGETITLQLVNSILIPLNLNKSGFSSPPGGEKYKHTKNANCVQLLQHITELPRQLAAEPVEASLSITVKLVDQFDDESFDCAMRLIPHYARLALANRKCPTWQESVDLLIRLLDQIEKAPRQASKMYAPLEAFFILLLSEASSKRMKILAAQVWEVKFKDENIILGDEFWKSIEPYYMQGAWAYPKGRQVLAELSNDHANKPALTTTLKRVANNSKVATPQRGTPQRLNRQQAAMAALTGQSPRANTPTRQRRGNQKLMSSTYSKNKDDDADFVMVESPISFNKRKISDKQLEKMKE